MILITGATGTVGRELVKLLVEGGAQVRAMTRDPAKAKFDPRVEVVAGDLDNAESVARAAKGAEAVFVLSTGPAIPAHDANAAQAAKAAGAKRIVKLSVLGAGGGGSDSAITQWHDGGEAAIRAAGVPWTFVRPGGFMSNALNWVGTVKGQGKIFAAYGDGKMPVVHPRDIAAVAARALTSPGHEGKAYPLTGGEALSMHDQARILSEAAGRPIQYVAIDDEAARAGMLKAGMPPPLVESLLKMAGHVRSGGAAQVLPTVQEVLGRKPLTFADWARENAAAFK